MFAVLSAQTVVSVWDVFADAKGLSSTSEVELLRERVYASLEAYCKQKYPEQQGRYATHGCGHHMLGRVSFSLFELLFCEL